MPDDANTQLSEQDEARRRVQDKLVAQATRESMILADNIAEAEQKMGELSSAIGHWMDEKAAWDEMASSMSARTS